MPVTCRERHADTVKKIPHKTLFPKVNTDDYLRQAATDLLGILKEPERNIASLTYGLQIINIHVYLAHTLKWTTIPVET